MTYYRITKFDPGKRDDQGAFLDHSEWTSISDIGKPAYNSVTYEQYEQVETAYADVIQLVLQEKGVQYLEASSVELHHTRKDFRKFEADGRLQNLKVDFDADARSLKNGLVLSGAQLEKTVRLILREVVWMLLRCESIEVRFGYDYYMYLRCEELSAATIAQIEKSGLFVEPYMEQLELDFIEED